MEEEEEEDSHRIQSSEDTENVKDQNVLQFLDSLDEYLSQMDSLSTILRQV